MKPIDDRLSDANPVAPSTYSAASFQHLYSATMATREETGRAFWRTFQLRVAASVGAVVVLMTGAVTALGGLGSELPVLNFAAAANHAGEKVAASASALAPTHMSMSIRPTTYNFTGLDALSTTSSSAPVFKLTAPTDLTGTLQSIGTALNVDFGTSATTATDTGVVTAQGTSANGAAYVGHIFDASGYATWDVEQQAASSTNGTVTGATGATGVSVTSGSTETSQLIDQATTMAKAACPGLSFGNAATDTQPGNAGTTVYLTVDLNGVPTGFKVDFQFDVTGALVAATGVSFTATSLGSYPLQSPATAANEITSQSSLVNQDRMGDVVTSVGSTLTVPAMASSPVSTTVVSPPASGTLRVAHLATRSAVSSSVSALDVTATGVSGASGVSGATGVSGASGPTGSTGVSGATGVSGSTGPVATLYGFGSPSGDSGVTGVTGDSGVTGVTGDSGVTGVTGVTGDSGVTGVTGPTDTPRPICIDCRGSFGPTGDSGVTGVTGPIAYSAAGSPSGDSGVTGVTGATDVSATGSSGASGATGPTPLPVGASGQPIVAYDLNSSTPMSPTERSLAESTGSTGATGASEATGASGSPMVTTTTEVTGSTGVVMARGATGATGAPVTSTTGAPSPILYTAVNGLPPLNETVKLSGYTLAYGLFTMNDGTTLALPEYVYHGAPTSNSQLDLTFKVIPIDAQYLDLANVAVRPNGAG